MSVSEDDPRCPECGGPIGVTATYCMHCSADLTDEREAADTTGDGTWDEPSRAGSDGSADDGRLLDPDGFVDDSLTVAVGTVGGLVVGVVTTLALLFLTGGAVALLGLLVWLGATAYLVRRRTVQEAVSKTAYGVALALLLVPLVPLSPVVDADLAGRGIGFIVLLALVAVPAAVLAGLGHLAGRFVPDGGGGSTPGTEARK